VQGAGHGVVSVRFETRSTGPGVMRTFDIDTADLTAANAVDSLDWPDYLAGSETQDSPPAGDDLTDR
jgi:DNA polymerase-4